MERSSTFVPRSETAEAETGVGPGVVATERVTSGDRQPRAVAMGLGRKPTGSGRRRWRIEGAGGQGMVTDRCRLEELMPVLGTNDKDVERGRAGEEKTDTVRLVAGT
jgi:hypothetical protein